MFDNSIRGGQIFWHQLTMFKQVALRSLSMSVLASVLIVAFLTFPKLHEYDFPAAITYSKAELAVWLQENKIRLCRICFHRPSKITKSYILGIMMPLALQSSQMLRRYH